MVWRVPKALGVALQVSYPITPDGRYFVVRSRLWRTSRPDLDPGERQHRVDELMSARRAVRTAKETGGGMADARRRVNTTKVALGERGPVWGDDGAPDLNRHLAKNTVYAEWFEALV